MPNWSYSKHVDFTAKDATILTFLTAQPSTRLFNRLVDKLEDPNAKNVAEKIRQLAKTDANDQPKPEQEPAAAQR